VAPVVQLIWRGQEQHDRHCQEGGGSLATIHTNFISKEAMAREFVTAMGERAGRIKNTYF
jgi:hypothetical protein